MHWITERVDLGKAEMWKGTACHLPVGEKILGFVLKMLFCGFLLLLASQVFVLRRSQSTQGSSEVFKLALGIAMS